MKKRILSVILLLAMLLTMVPFAAAAEEVANDAVQNGAGTENEAAEAFDYESLYVKEGLVNLFTVYGENNGLDLSKATWTDKLKGSVATLMGTGAKTGDPTRWVQNADGSFGFNVLKGAIMENGEYSETGDGATASLGQHLGNNIRLSFGLPLLPDGSFTVEYMAKYKPLYVRDMSTAEAQATIKIATDENGNYLETYDYDTTPVGNYLYDPPVDRLGWFSSISQTTDGVGIWGTDGTEAFRGQVNWAFMWKTWGSSEKNPNPWNGCWVGTDGNTALTGLAIKGNAFQTNNMIRTYAITVDEQVTGEGESRVTSGNLILYRDGAFYNSAAMGGGRVNSTANGTTADKVGSDPYHHTDVEYSAYPDNTGFYLSNKRPTDFYVVRIYDRALTAEEYMQNAAVDTMQYYGITFTEAELADAMFMKLAYSVLAKAEIETDPLAFEGAKTTLLAALAGAAEEAAMVNQYAAPEHLTAFFSAFVEDSINTAEGTWRNIVGWDNATLMNASAWTIRDSGAVGFDLWAGVMKGGTYTAGTTGAPTSTRYFKNNDTYLDLNIANLSSEDFTVEYVAKYNPLWILDGDKSTADNVVFYEKDGALFSAWDQGGNDAIPNELGLATDVLGFFTSNTQNIDGGTGWNNTPRGSLHWFFKNYEWYRTTNHNFLTGGWGTLGTSKEGGQPFHKTASNVVTSYGIYVDETVTDAGETEALFGLYRDTVAFNDNSAKINSTANNATIDVVEGYYYYVGTDGVKYIVKSEVKDGERTNRFYAPNGDQAPVYLKGVNGGSTDKTTFECFLVADNSKVEAANYFKTVEKNGHPQQGHEDWGTAYDAGEFGADAAFYLSMSTPTDFFTIRVYDKVLTVAEQKQNLFADKLHYYGIELSDRILEDEDVYAAVAAIISECDIVSDPAEKQATKVALEAKIQAYLDFIDDLNYDDTMYVTEDLTSFFTAFEGEESFINTDGADKVWYNRVVGQANATFKGGNIWKLGEGGGVGKYYIHGTYTDGVFKETNASNTSVTNDYSLYFGNALLPKDDFTVEYLAFFPQIYAEVVENGEKTGALYGHYSGIYTAEGHTVDQIGWLEFNSVRPGGRFDDIDNNLRARVAENSCTGWGGTEPGTPGYTYGFGSTAFRIDTRNTLKVDTYGVLRDETTVTEKGVVVEQTAVYTVTHNGGAQANGSRSYTTKNGFVAGGGNNKDSQYFFGEDDGDFWLSKSAGATFYAVRIYDRVLTEAEQQQNRLADILYYYGVELTAEQKAEQALLDSVRAEFGVLSPDPLEKAARATELRTYVNEYAEIKAANAALVNSYAAPEHLTALFTVFSRTKIDLANGTWVNLVDGGASATLRSAANWTLRDSGAVGFDLWAGQMKADVYTADKTGAPTSTRYFKNNDTYLDLNIANLSSEDFTVEYVAKYNPLWILDGDKSTADNVVFYEKDGALFSAWDQGGNDAIPNELGLATDVLGFFTSNTQNIDGGTGWNNTPRGSLHWFFKNYEWYRTTNHNFLTGGWGTLGTSKEGGQPFHKTASNVVTSYGIYVDETVTDAGETEALFGLYRDTVAFNDNSAKINSTANNATIDVVEGYYYYVGTDGVKYIVKSEVKDGERTNRFYAPNGDQAPVYLKGVNGGSTDKTTFECFLVADNSKVEAANYFKTVEKNGHPQQGHEDWGTAYDAGEFGADAAFYLSMSTPTDFFTIRVYDKALTDAEKQYNYMMDLLHYYGLKLDPAIAADADLTARFAAAVAGITLALDPLEKAAAKLEISDAATALLTVESPIYNLYVEDGMTAHFSSLLPTDGSASVAAGVWKNRVAGGANATFGNADMWKKNPNGSVGYSLFYGQMDADGNFTKDSAYNTYNHTTACGTSLNLGIDLLPEDNFTVEFVAMFKPIYVADAAGDIAVDAEGNLVEAADQGYDWISRKDPSTYEYGVVIRMGYLQAFASPHDGYWVGSSSHKRGDYMWTISGALGWKESNSTNKTLTSLSGNEDVLFTNSVVRSYAITRTEDTADNLKAVYDFVRDGETYATWNFNGADVKANVNGYAVANFDIAEKDLEQSQVNAIAPNTKLAEDKYNMKAKPADNPDAPDERMTYAPANKFLLSERHPTDFYAVRIYDRVLTKEEQMRNHLADIALYYGLDLGDEIFTGSALGNELLSDFAEALSTATIVTNGLEKRANKAFYQSVIDNIVFEATYESPSDYSEMYVTEGLVGLFTAFTGSGTVDVFKGEWQNEAPAAAVATYGSAKLEGSWTKELLGVGYTASGSTWDDISKQLNRSISLSDDYEELENFTVEAFATVIGGTDVNGNRFVYESTDKDGNLLGVAGQAYTSGRNNFRFGILTSLGFNTLSGINGIAATGSAANLGNRWAVTNIAYTGSNWTAQQAYAEAEDAEFATVYDDAGWLKMGVDLYTPAPGLMQVTKATDSNGITYNVAYNNDAPSVSFSMSSKEHGDIKDYTEKGRDYETGRRFSLFNTQAATVYAVRVYDRVLSADEMLINSFVDKAAYYQLEIDSFAGFETAEKVEVANIFANLSYERDKADVQALYDFYAEGGAESLVNTLVGFDGYNPILATASGYRAVFQVNQEAYNLLTKSGYTVTYGALVAPGGNFNSLEDVTLENESVKNIVVAGEGGSGIYYKPAGARGYYYTAAVTADDPVYYSVGMIVRGYAVVTKGEESFVVYTDATLNGSNQVSILDAADYFVNAYDGDIVTQYTYMNSAVLRNILEESGYAARVSLEDDLTIYVDAENGNDDNKDVEMAGQTPETAYKTVNAAFAAAKAHFAQAGRKTVTIRLAAGTYNVTEELVLKAEDILATGYSLDVIGAGDSTILTTETEIAYDSALTDAAGNRYVQLPAGANGLYPDFRTLYVNGKFVNHATGGSHEDTYGIEDFYILDANGNKLNPVQAYDRNHDGTIDENDHGSDGKPTNDWYLNEEGVNAAKWAVFTLPASMFDTDKLAQYAGAELHYTWDWASSMSHIDHVEQSGGSVLAYVPYGQLASGYKDTKIAGKRAWLENALVLATSSVHASEGYYYDSVSGRLYYKGLSETPKLTYASLSNMFVFENVDNISIQNMAITGVDSNYITDDIGIHLSQGGHLTTRNNEKQATSLGWVEHAAIYGKNMDNLLVSNVSVHDVAGAGVTIKGYATDIIIDSSSFENIGGSAIQIASYKDDGTGEYIKNITITNNYVNLTGQLYRACAAIMTGNVASAKVIGNTVIGSTWSAFSFGLSWNDPKATNDQIVNGAPFYCYDLEIAYNYVTDMMTCQGDGGAFYLNGGAVSIASNDTKVYNYLHHNYVVMSENSGLHGNNANGWRNVYCYYFENSASNWFANENVLVNEVNQNLSYAGATFYGVYLQAYEPSDSQARNITLLDNYFIGFKKIGQIYNYHASNPNAEFGQVANDYVFKYAADLADSWALDGTHNNATAKWEWTREETAEEVVTSIFHAAGSDKSTVGKDISFAYEIEGVPFDPSKYTAADRVVLKEGNVIDVTEIKGVEISTVTFTDGETSVSLKGLVGSPVKAPTYFAQPNYTYTFSVDGEVVDLADYAFPAEGSVEIDVTAVAETYTVTFVGGIVEASTEVFEGDTFEIPAEMKIAGKNPTLYYDGAELDLATFKMPAEDIQVRIEYKDARYTARFVDESGRLLKENDGRYGNRVTNPKLTKDYHTTQYLLNGVVTPIEEIVFPEGNLEITVKYVPNAYDVQFQASVITADDATVHNYGSVNVVFGEVIDASTIDTSAVRGCKEGALLKFVAWQNFTSGVTVLDAALMEAGCIVYATTEWEDIPAHNATFTRDGFEDITVSVFEGSAIELPAELLKAGYNVVLTAKGEPVDLATYTMPTEDVTFAVAYEAIEYTVTITDGEKSDSFVGTVEDTVSFATDFTKEHYTVVYKVKGEEIDIATYKVPVDGAEITVEYVDVLYSATITDEFGNTQTVTGIFGAAVEFNMTDFVAPENTTIKYSVNGGDLVDELPALTFTVEGIEVEVVYVENAPVEPEYKLGDVNIDGVVDYKDINILVGYLAGNIDATNIKGDGDVNADDVVDYKDINILVGYLAGNVELG